ncbi:unnamed protein product, partial [Allacma fusca]
ESPFQVPNFDHQDEIMRQLEDLDEKDVHVKQKRESPEDPTGVCL